MKSTLRLGHHRLTKGLKKQLTEMIAKRELRCSRFRNRPEDPEYIITSIRFSKNSNTITYEGPAPLAKPKHANDWERHFSLQTSIATGKLYIEIF